MGSEESADELMSYVPPVGWADLATKADLLVLRSDIAVVRAAPRRVTEACRRS